MHRFLSLTLPVLYLALSAGCTETCVGVGTGSLATFQVDCERLQFMRSTDTMSITIHDLDDGQIDLVVTNVGTVGPGLHFGEGGDYGMDGNYHSSSVSIAELQDSWLKTTAWEGVSGESFDQAVSIEFYIEVLSTSTSDGGTIEGSADQVPVY